MGTSRETRLVGSFTADTENGETVVVNVFANFTTSRNLDGETSTLQGIPKLVTEDGYDVNRIEKGRYQVLDAYDKFVITSDDPNAV